MDNDTDAGAVGLVKRLQTLRHEATAGPWEAEERGAYNDFGGDSRVILGQDMRLAVVHTNGRAETEANAELIALIPQMLDLIARLTNPAEPLPPPLVMAASCECGLPQAGSCSYCTGIGRRIGVPADLSKATRWTERVGRRRRGE